MLRPKRIEPQPGQESVWDYPRPPRLEETSKHIQLFFNGQLLADTRRAKRVLETSHPPVYYLPTEDIRMDYLAVNGTGSWCEWKGQVTYYDVAIGSRVARHIAWAYFKPSPAFRAIKDHLAFYAWAMDKCLLDGEQVTPQPGNFYGGWITKDIVGPFKGGPGTSGW